MPNYTSSEDIRDVLQILAAVKTRECVNKGSKNRGTIIAYAELTRIEQRLQDALKKVEALGDFPRPMSVTPRRVPIDTHHCASGHLIMHGHCQAQRIRGTDNCSCDCQECNPNKGE